MNKYKESMLNQNAMMSKACQILWLVCSIGLLQAAGEEIGPDTGSSEAAGRTESVLICTSLVPAGIEVRCRRPEALRIGEIYCAINNIKLNPAEDIQPLIDLLRVAAAEFPISAEFPHLNSVPELYRTSETFLSNLKDNQDFMDHRRQLIAINLVTYMAERVIEILGLNLSPVIQNQDGQEGFVHSISKNYNYTLGELRQKPDLAYLLPEVEGRLSPSHLLVSAQLRPQNPELWALLHTALSELIKARAEPNGNLESVIACLDAIPLPECASSFREIQNRALHDKNEGEVETREVDLNKLIDRTGKALSDICDKKYIRIWYGP